MRLRPGWFNPRNLEVWWNCLKSAVSIIDTSGERHSHSTDHSPYISQLFPLKNIWQANQPIRRSVESDHSSGLRSRDRAQKDIKRKKFHHHEVLANHTPQLRTGCRLHSGRSGDTLSAGPELILEIPDLY